MRLAVISDMHGNAVGLETALADIDRAGCDQIVCLGDAVQGGPQPAEVVEILRARRIPTVMGNSDAWLLSGTETGAENIPEDRRKKMEEVRQWMLGKLSDTQKELISGYQPTITIDLGRGEKLLCYHGSPQSFDDVLLPDTPIERFQELLPTDQARFFCGGHTHVQFLRHLGHGFHFNPGSVGFAYRYNQTGDFKADPYSEYAIFDVDGGRFGLEFRRLPVDVGRLIEAYRTSGRPYAEEAIAQYLP